MRIWMYPGSFDPVTLGHIDIAERGAKLCDKLYISVLNNLDKTYTFTIEERIELIKKSCDHIPNIEVTTFNGLLVEHAKSHNVDALLRGLRNMSDFQLEAQLASLNKRIGNGIETILIMSQEQHIYTSSSVLKQIGSLGGDISSLVSDKINQDVLNRLNKR